MTTESNCFPQDSSEPGYQNWLVGQKQNHNRYGSTTASEPRVQIPPGLHLSSRRGPEVELYDVAGVHLLAPMQESSDVAVESNSVAESRYSREPWFSSCWPTPGQARRTSRSNYFNDPVVLTNKNTIVPSPVPYTLGRLPTKAAHGNGNTVRTSLCLAANFNPLKRRFRARSANRERDSPARCSPPSLCGIPIAGCTSVPHDKTHRLSVEQNNFYKYGFTLTYRRSEISTFLLLQLLISIAQSVFIVTSASSNTAVVPEPSHRSRSITSFLRLHLSHPDWGRLILLLCSSVFSLAGLLSANWDWIATRSTDEQDTKQKDPPKTGDRNVANLLIVQLFHRRLRSAHVFAYLACVLLGIAVLPWLSLCQLIQVLRNPHGSSALYPTDKCIGAPKTNVSIFSSFVSDPVTLHFPTWFLQPFGVSDPNESLWVLLWIVVALQGLFDRDGLWTRHWRYVLTILLSVAHLVLSTVFGVLVIGHASSTSGLVSPVNGSQPCPAWISTATFLPGTRWWDDLGGMLFRTNVSAVIALLAAHCIGRLVATMTSAQRYHLFLTAGLTQAKLHRLELTEVKLSQLTKSLVPAPLADELGRDFVAGYLGWSSPLVIYLRNVSFLSAELVGLSSLASVVANSPTASIASQQFVALLNDMFGCFDRIARREGCYRVRLNATEYMCIAGYPETRVDHARSCVDFGLSMLQIVDELAEMANVQLDLRVAVHTGTAYAAVLGRTRLGFELTGDDVLYTSYLRHSAIRPGRVLTSRSTFNQLPEGFRGEPGPLIGLPNPLTSVSPNAEPSSTPIKTMETFFVQPRQTSNKTIGGKTNNTDSTLKTPNPEWPRLGELSLENLGLLNRLATAASIVCRRPASENSPVHSNNSSVELPFDSLLFSPPMRTTAKGEIEESREAQLGLLQALSSSEFDETTSSRCGTRPREEAAPSRDPSTSELLAMAAVTVAQSFERGNDSIECSEKLVPCQNRAGRLRGKCATDGPDSADSGASELGPENSMGVSQATTTTSAAHTGLAGVAGPTLHESETSWKPLVQQLPWLCTSPPGFQAPHWLTMATGPCCVVNCPERCTDGMLYANFSEAESKKQTWSGSCCPGCCVSHGSKDDKEEDTSTETVSSRWPDNLLHILTLATGILLPYGLLIALINLLTISRSFVFLTAYLVAVAYLSLMLLTWRLLKRFSPLSPFVRSIPARALVTGSIFVVVAAELINLSMCRPADSTRLLTNSSSGVRSLPSVFFLLPPSKNPSVDSDSTTNQLCTIPVQFALLSTISCLLPAIVYATVIYASSLPWIGSDSVRPYHTSSGACVVLAPQLTRFLCGLLILLAHGGVYLWSVLHNGMFHWMQPSSTNKSASFIEKNLLHSTITQHWYGLVAFSLLAFVLPRNLEYQAHLLRQWIAKGHEAVQSLMATRLALARLLISAVPRFVVAVLCSPTKGGELYSKPYPLVGLVLIQLSVNPDPRTKGGSMNRTAGPPNDSTEKSSNTTDESEEPAQIADRLRLLNHTISLIDGLATTGGMRGGSTKHVEVNNSGSRVSKDSKDGGSAAERMNSSQVAESLPSLVKVHVGGATVGYAVGLLPSDMIHDSDSRTEHLTHLLTFTERVLEACEQVNSKAKSTNSFIHLRVALHAGPAVVGLIGKQRPVFNLWGDPVNVCLHLIHESHVPALNRQHLLLATDDVINAIPCTLLNTTLKSGQPLVWRCVDTQTGRILLSAQVPASAAPGGPNRSRPCLPLHFCSILATIPEPDVDYANRAAFAMLNLAKCTSFKTPEPQLGLPGVQRIPKTAASVPPEHTANVQPILRQSVVVSQVQPATVLPRPTSVAHSNLASVPPKNMVVPHRYSRGHPLQPVAMHQPQSIVPPPPPPHKRVYAYKEDQGGLLKQPYAPGGPAGLPHSGSNVTHSWAVSGPHTSHSITEGLCDNTATNHAYIRASPERKYSEPPETITRQAVRRGVVSQCAGTRTHDYSIVNFEPPEPCPARVTSQLLEPRLSMQPVVPSPPHPIDHRRGEYWPNLPNKTSMNGVPLDSKTKLGRAGYESAEKAKPLVSLPQANEAEQPSNNQLLLPSLPGGALRPVSLSSTDSFLAAERACATEVDEVANSRLVRDSLKHTQLNGHPHNEENSGSGTELVSHHNPLYTDNEYDSMTESQGNLVNAGKRKRMRGLAQSTRSNSAHSKNGTSATSEKRALLSSHVLPPTSSASIENKNENSRMNEEVHSIGKPATTRLHLPRAKEGSPVNDKLLDFPDIQRPSSPGGGYLHCIMGPVQSNSVQVTVSYGSGGYVAAVQPSHTGPSSSSTSSAARSAPGNTGYGSDRRQPLLDSGNRDDGSLQLWPNNCLQSDRIALTKTVPTYTNTGKVKNDSSGLWEQSPKLAHFLKDTASPVASDVDPMEGEYAGTYSLGPLSMAVQPSVADDGITSCDGDFGDYEDEADPNNEEEDNESAMPESMTSSYTRPMAYPNWSPQRPLTSNPFNLDLPVGHVPQNCMTDSLLANPDLDARESEDFEPSRFNSPDEPIDPKQAPSLLEAAFVPLSHQHEGVGESDGDEMFAYHDRPGVFHINPYSIQGHLRFVPPQSQQHRSPNPMPPGTNGHTLCGYFPPGPQFISEHSIQLQCSPKPSKPSLPEIAPVGLPNFAQQRSITANDEIAQSDYDNLSHTHASLLNGRLCANGPSGPNGPSSRKHLDQYQWQRAPPGKDSDAMSGYAGDAATSVYDTGDDEEDERPRGHLKTSHSLSPQPSFSGPPKLMPIPHSAIACTTQAFMPGARYLATEQAQSPNTRRGVIDRTQPGHPMNKAPIVMSSQLVQNNALNRQPSTAGSQTSSLDQQRSEYDNVDRSSTSGRTNRATSPSDTSMSQVVPNGTNSPHTNRPRRVESLGKGSSSRGSGARAMFDAEIAAEARRISRQFRAMGWIPASDYLHSSENANMIVDDLRPKTSDILDIKQARSRIESPPRNPPRPHLFLLPTDPQLSMPCSRQASFRNRSRRGPTSAADSETVTSVTSQFDEDEDEMDYGARTDASDLEDILNETVQYELNGTNPNPDAWILDSYPGRELGCLMVRPRSLSATCLTEAASGGEALAGLLFASDSSDVSSDEKEGATSPDPDETQQKRFTNDLHNAQRPSAPSARLCDRQRKAVRRVKSSRTSQRSGELSGDNSGFTRLKRRAARVRSLLPPDLQPFILPGCMSSLSRSSSMASSIGIHHPKTGLVFLSLSRHRQQLGRNKAGRYQMRRYQPARCSSDPELRIEAPRKTSQ